MGNVVDTGIVGLQDKITTLQNLNKKADITIKHIKQQRKEDLFHFKQKLNEYEEVIEESKKKNGELMFNISNFEKKLDSYKTKTKALKLKLEEEIKKKELEMQAMVEKKEQEIKDLKRDLAEEMSKRTTELEVLAEKKEEEMMILKTHIDRINADHEKLIEEHNTEYKALEYDFEVMSTRIEQMGTKMASQATDLRESKLGYEAVKDRIQGLIKKIDHVDSDEFLVAFMDDNNIPYMDDNYEKEMYKTLLEYVNNFLSESQD